MKKGIFWLNIHVKYSILDWNWKNEIKRKRDVKGCRELASEGFQVRRSDEFESEILLRNLSSFDSLDVHQAYLHVFNIKAENKNHEVHVHVGREKEQ